MTTKILFYFFLQIFALLTFAQAPVWSNYTAASVVNKLLSKNEYIWAATTGGLVKYNTLTGQKDLHIKSLSGMLDNSVIDVAINPITGLVWVATAKTGLFSFDGTNWINYNTQNSQIPANNINGLAIEGNGKLWIATNLGVSFFNGNNTWIHYKTSNSALPHNQVRSIFIDEDGNKWFCTSGGIGVLNPNNTQWTIYTTMQGLTSNFINNVCYTPTGTIVATSWSTGLMEYSNNQWTSVSTPVTDISLVYYDSNGTMWIGSSNNGLWQKNAGGTWANVLPDPPSISRGINSITEDSLHHIWVGTRAGVYEYVNGVFTRKYWGNSGLSADWITDIYVDANKMAWIGTNEGLNRFDGTNWAAISQQDLGFTYQIVSAVNGDANGNIWAGGYNSLSKFDGNTWQPQNVGTTFFGYVKDIKVAADGDIWLATWGGIVHISGQTVNLLKMSNSPALLTNLLNHLFIDSNQTIWAGSQKGLYQIDDATNAISIIHPSCFWSEVNIGGFCEYPAGTVVIPTQRRLSYLTGTNCVSLDTTDGVPNQGNTQSDIKLDKNNHIWIGYDEITSLNTGILSTGSVAEYDGVNWNYYTANNSELAHERIYAIFADEDNDIWIGTEAGLNIIHNSTVSIEDGKNQSFAGINHPNPFSSTTTIQNPFSSTYKTTLTVSDINGNILKTEDIELGEKEISFNGSQLAEGIYMYALRCEQGVCIGKMCIIR